MNLTAAKDLFLNDATNKQRFVENFGQDLEAAGCKVFYTSGDADDLIVQKALESSDVQDTILVGDDTDLLVLAIYHSKNSKLKTKKECKTTNFGYQQSEKEHGHVQLQAYCFSMPFSVAIQLLGRLGLEKVQS